MNRIATMLLLSAALLPCLVAQQDEHYTHAATAPELAAQSFTYRHNDMQSTSVTHVFEIVFGSPPTTASTTITPYMSGGTVCGVPTTSSSTVSFVVSTTGICDYYVVNVSWTGSPSSVVLNITGTHSSLARKTGLGAYTVAAAAPPPDGCAQFASGTLGSTGSGCSSGSGAAIPNTPHLLVGGSAGAVDSGIATADLPRLSQPNTFAGLATFMGGLQGDPSKPAMTKWSAGTAALPCTLDATVPVQDCFVAAAGVPQRSLNGAAFYTPVDLITGAAVTVSGHTATINAATPAQVSALQAGVANGTISANTNILPVQRYAGATFGDQINACMADCNAQGIGGVCDASMLTGTLTTNVEVQVKSGPGYTCALKVPRSAKWKWNLQDPTKCGIRVFNGSPVYGDPSSTAGMRTMTVMMDDTVTTSSLATVCSNLNPVLNEDYITISDLNVIDPASLTHTFASGYLVYIQNAVDQSKLARLNIENDHNGGELWVKGCCNTNLEDIELGGGPGDTGGIDLVIADGSNVQGRNITTNGNSKSNPAIDVGPNAQFALNGWYAETNGDIPYVANPVGTIRVAAGGVVQVNGGRANARCSSDATCLGMSVFENHGGVISTDGLQTTGGFVTAITDATGVLAPVPVTVLGGSNGGQVGYIPAYSTQHVVEKLVSDYASATTQTLGTNMVGSVPGKLGTLQLDDFNSTSAYGTIIYSYGQFHVDNAYGGSYRTLSGPDVVKTNSTVIVQDLSGNGLYTLNPYNTPTTCFAAGFILTAGDGHAVWCSAINATPVTKF